MCIERIYDYYTSVGYDWELLLNKYKELLITIVCEEDVHTAYRAYWIGEILKQRFKKEELSCWCYSVNTRFRYRRFNNCVQKIHEENPVLAKEIYLNDGKVFNVTYILALYKIKKDSNSSWTDIINDYLANKSKPMTRAEKKNIKISVKQEPRGDPNHAKCKALIYTIESWKATFELSVANIEINSLSDDAYKELKKVMKEFNDHFRIGVRQ